jgi:hypothetical protein
MWMGGNVPLGYVKDRKLIVNEPEASTVRLIFKRYAELGSVALLKAELDRLGIVSKRRPPALCGSAWRHRCEHDQDRLLRVGPGVASFLHESS